MITVLIADDQALIRTAVGELVEHEDGLTVVGEAVNGRQAIDQVRALRPDIVLMDIRMPMLDGIEATRAICGDPDLTTTRIVILTTFEDDEYVLQALQAGASGFIGKGAEAAELMNAIRTVHQGEALLSPRATRALITRYLAPAPEPSLTVPRELELLTDREREILLLVGQGLSNVEMAERLVISPQTAKTHLNRIMTQALCPRPRPAGDHRVRVRAAAAGTTLTGSPGIAGRTRESASFEPRIRETGAARSAMWLERPAQLRGVRIALAPAHPHQGQPLTRPSTSSGRVFPSRN